jgi:hypothetical protein
MIGVVALLDLFFCGLPKWHHGVKGPLKGSYKAAWFLPNHCVPDQPMAPLSRHGVTTYGDRASSSILYFKEKFSGNIKNDWCCSSSRFIFLRVAQVASRRKRILDACKQHGFYPTIACRTSQWHLLADMVLQRMGIDLFFCGLPKWHHGVKGPLKGSYITRCY